MVGFLPQDFLEPVNGRLKLALTGQGFRKPNARLHVVGVTGQKGFQGLLGPGRLPCQQLLPGLSLQGQAVGRRLHQLHSPGCRLLFLFQVAQVLIGVGQSYPGRRKLRSCRHRLLQQRRCGHKVPLGQKLHPAGVGGQGLHVHRRRRRKLRRGGGFDVGPQLFSYSRRQGGKFAGFSLLGRQAGRLNRTLQVPVHRLDHYRIPQHPHASGHKSVGVEKLAELLHLAVPKPGRLQVQVGQGAKHPHTWDHRQGGAFPQVCRQGIGYFGGQPGQLGPAGFIVEGQNRHRVLRRS
ncbi:hypothetical protein HRbin09_01028 [bacterium HR09]|nr:hypothetical protein HRbin09_01028 [bacterium HR09]